MRRVWVKGNKRTRPEVVAACLRPVMRARTFDEVLASSAEAAGTLKGLGIFKSVNLILDDIPEEDLATATAADRAACDLRVELQEAKLTRLQIKTSTTVGENEPEVVRVFLTPPALHPNPVSDQQWIRSLLDRVPGSERGAVQRFREGGDDVGKCPNRHLELARALEFGV